MSDIADIKIDVNAHLWWTGQLALGIYRDIYCIYATHTVGLYLLVPDQEDRKLLRGWVGVRGFGK
jgi:hypothetical protein